MHSVLFSKKTTELSHLHVTWSHLADEKHYQNRLTIFPVELSLQ